MGEREDAGEGARGTSAKASHACCKWCIPKNVGTVLKRLRPYYAHGEGSVNKKTKKRLPTLFFCQGVRQGGVAKTKQNKVEKKRHVLDSPRNLNVPFFFSRFFARFRSVAPFSLFCVLPVDDVECECGLDLKAAGVSIPLFWIMVWDSGMKSRSLVFLCLRQQLISLSST